MNKFCKGLKSRYFEGIAWMKADEGLPGMMYLATTIMVFFIICKVNPENSMQYAKTIGVNLALIYLYSIVANRFNPIIHLLGFVCIEFFTALSIGKGLTFGYALFVVPIAIAISMILVTENNILFEDFISLKNIGNFGTVILTTLIPVITIAIPLVFMKWSILTKIAIVVGFIFIAPLVCWADSEDYGIFGAIGIEW